MDEVKKIGDYSVKYSMYIGHKDIALGENANADKDERYMCCFVENNAIFERYSEALVSDDFAEIAKVFGQRVADAAEEIIRENESAGKELGTNEEITAEDCVPISSEDSGSGKRGRTRITTTGSLQIIFTQIIHYPSRNTPPQSRPRRT